MGRTLCLEERPKVRFGLGDMRKFMSHMLTTSYGTWLMRRQVMLWASLLFFTGMRPGEAAYTGGYGVDGHYLHTKNFQVRRLEDDLYGVRFAILMEVSWLKHNRFRGVTYVFKGILIRVSNSGER